MSVFYNPETRNPERVYRIEDVRLLEKNDPQYTAYWLEAYLSKDALISNDRSGMLSWIEDSNLYVAKCTGTWDYIPLYADTVCIINADAGDAYFISPEIASQWVDRYKFRNDGIVYSKEFDVYTVHYYIESIPEV